MPKPTNEFQIRPEGQLAFYLHIYTSSSAMQGLLDAIEESAIANGVDLTCNYRGNKNSVLYLHGYNNDSIASVQAVKESVKTLADSHEMKVYYLAEHC